MLVLTAYLNIFFMMHMLILVANFSYAVHLIVFT